MKFEWVDANIVLDCHRQKQIDYIAKKEEEFLRKLSGDGNPFTGRNFKSREPRLEG